MLSDSSHALGFENELVGANARRFCELMHVDRVTFVNTGTEATTLAARLARLYRRRSRIVVFEGSYHGHFDGFMGVPSAGADGRAAPASSTVSPAFVEDLSVLHYDDDASLSYIDENAATIAAVFVEPIQAQHDVSVQPRAFLRGCVS